MRQFNLAALGQRAITAQQACEQFADQLEQPRAAARRVKPRPLLDERRDLHVACA